jgi:uncharacterized membrane protein HdeD (DUF308 family)
MNPAAYTQGNSGGFRSQIENCEAAAMQDLYARNWWAILIRGIIAIVFGVVAIIWPNETLFILITLFGVFCLVDGIFALVAAIRAATHHAHWAALVVEGILGLIVGLIAIFHPSAAAVAFLFLIAAWAIITGFLELFAAFRLRRELGGEVLLVLGGIISIVFGILLFASPSAGVVVIAWLIGVYAILFGVLLVGLSFRLKAWYDSGSPGGTQPAIGSA